MLSGTERIIGKSFNDIIILYTNNQLVRLNKEIEKRIIRHHWVVGGKPPFPNVVMPLKVILLITSV
jgi:hypothetical protein